MSMIHASRIVYREWKSAAPEIGYVRATAAAVMTLCFVSLFPLKELDELPEKSIEKATSSTEETDG